MQGKVNPQPPVSLHDIMLITKHPRNSTLNPIPRPQTLNPEPKASTPTQTQNLNPQPSTFKTPPPGSIPKGAQSARKGQSPSSGDFQQYHFNKTRSNSKSYIVFAGYARCHDRQRSRSLPLIAQYKRWVGGGDPPWGSSMEFIDTKSIRRPPCS